MKKVFFLLLTVGLIGSAFTTQKSQVNHTSMRNGTGIAFTGMNYEAAVQKAKATGKIVFIDAYTDWCGPCKKMAATAFMDDQVANTFNSKFINIKIEMEKSTDGPEVAKRFGVKAYPTLLFVDGNGKLVKSVIGYQTPEQLLAIGKSL